MPALWSLYPRPAPGCAAGPRKEPRMRCSTKLGRLAFAAMGLALARPAVARADAPPPAKIAAGELDVYRPLANFGFRGFSLKVPLTVAARLEGVSDIPVDRDGTRFRTGAAVSPMARL